MCHTRMITTVALTLNSIIISSHCGAERVSSRRPCRRATPSLAILRLIIPALSAHRLLTTRGRCRAPHQHQSPLLIQSHHNLTIHPRSLSLALALSPSLALSFSPFLLLSFSPSPLLSFSPRSGVFRAASAPPPCRTDSCAGAWRTLEGGRSIITITSIVTDIISSSISTTTSSYSMIL